MTMIETITTAKDRGKWKTIGPLPQPFGKPNTLNDISSMFPCKKNLTHAYLTPIVAENESNLLQMYGILITLYLCHIA